MAGSNASFSSSGSSSSNSSTGSGRARKPIRRNTSRRQVAVTDSNLPTPTQDTVTAGSLTATRQTTSKNTHRRRRRRGTTTRRASVMIDHDNEISISNEIMDTHEDTATSATGISQTVGSSTARRASTFYQLQIPIHQNLSSTSVDSAGLLDHREQKYTRPRRSSTLGGDIARTYRHAGSHPHLMPSGSTSHMNTHVHSHGGGVSPGRRHHQHNSYFHQDYTPTGEEGGPPELRRGPTGDYLSDAEFDAPDTQPLIPRTPINETPGHGLFVTERSGLFPRPSNRPPSTSSRSSGKRKHLGYGSVNFPPSVPASPSLQPYGNVGGMGIDESISPGDGNRRRHSIGDELFINIDGDGEQAGGYMDSPPISPIGLRRMEQAEEDVCFPIGDRLTDGMGTPRRGENGSIRNGRRRRRREWPDLTIMEEWSREEKEERTGGIRARQVHEPVYIGGRLRPTLRDWHREAEDLPYRFTYFNDELPATIHAQTISELITPGETTFRDLFMPPPRKLSDSDCSSDEGDLIDVRERNTSGSLVASEGGATPKLGASRDSVRGSEENLDPSTLPGGISGVPQNKTRMGDTIATAPSPAIVAAVEEGERPTWWLDVLSPTKAEMKVFQDAFGIHPLTAEDILMQEPREKVELFRNYYLVSYRTFEQDPADEDFMEPVNFYIIVFRTGVLSFHFSMTPHGANVRRRIRQLKDYMTITADWISYALIDNITDAFGPIIQNIEEECDEIDDIILAEVEDANSGSKPPSMNNGKLGRPGTAEKSDASTIAEQDDASMLRRIATCRKKVMGLYRLMGNKADVIKGFSKRCNEHWDVAPRSEIGLYLGDIQDHIVTMVANLVHVEKILSRGHSNYLAQISIKMNERSEATADTLGRLTVLGTIVLPMNIVTGLWGMNVLVPGQGIEDNLNWFWCITAGLLMFGILCYFVAKRVYGIV